MRLLKETFEFRTNTEADALKLIEEYRTNANSKGYTVTKASYTRKDKKSKGEIIDTAYVITLTLTHGGAWDELE